MHDFFLKIVRIWHGNAWNKAALILIAGGVISITSIVQYLIPPLGAHFGVRITIPETSLWVSFALIGVGVLVLILSRLTPDWATKTSQPHSAPGTLAGEIEWLRAQAELTQRSVSTEAVSVADKLIWKEMVIWQDYVPGTNPPLLDRIQIGILLENTADFAVQYEIEEIETQVEGRSPETGKWSRDAIMDPHSRARCLDYRIDLGGIPPATLKGQMKIVLSYGRLGDKRPHRLPLKANLEVIYDPVTGRYLETRVFWDVKFRTENTR